MIQADGIEPKSLHPLLPAESHIVRLHFADAQPNKPGTRRFSVDLQGKTVINEMDIVGSSGQSRRSLVREFRDVKIGSELTIDFKPISGEPVISGVEIMLQAE